MRFHGANVQVANELTAGDLDHHFHDISAFVPENTIAVILYSRRGAGGGALDLWVYSDEGADSTTLQAWGSAVLIGIGEGSQRFEWALEQINSFWDVWLYGYFTQ